MSAASKVLYKHLKDYPLSTEGYREVGIPAVAAALYCEHMQPPADERVDKQAHELSWVYLLEEQPWLGVP
jgi:hypothetical protein